LAAGSILASGVGAVIFAAHNGNTGRPADGGAAARGRSLDRPLSSRTQPALHLDRALTDEKLTTTYNNFYEFGSQKIDCFRSPGMKIRPWTIRIDGLVDKPMTVDIDDLLKKMPLEEKALPHRCVEAWSMAVPWSGFPMAAFRRFREAAGLGENMSNWPPFSTPRPRPARRSSGTLGPMSRA